MSQAYDVIVLGGGTGGYTAAIRAAQLGKTVAIVEQDKLGGTCLHRGCIPSKTLLRSAEMFAAMKESEAFGISVESAKLDFGKVQKRKAAIVEQLHSGVQYLMRKNKIDVYHGKGRLIGPSIFSPRSGTVSVELPDEEILNLVPQHLIIATGSRPRKLPGLEADGTVVLTSDEALQLEELPKSILIVGGGVIGVEWASMLNDFGVEVTVAEYSSRLVPTEDADISRELERLLKKRGVRVLTNAKVLAETLVTSSEGAVLSVETKRGLQELRVEKVLLSVGREANIDSIALDNTDVRVENGYIRVNEHMQTAENHIYAIGDCIGGLQLAHAAAHEGITAVEHLAGRQPHSYGAHQIPRCIYTRPEIASIGYTEQEALDKGFDIKTSKVQFKALAKAMILGDNDGFVKVVADRKTNDILGVHMIGAHVTDYISEAALAQLLNATPWEVGRTIHAHPTLSEILGEAMLAVDGQAINL
ncbi:dihydrolipoyl dehydrogenase [Paenibacillus sp. GD4]|uniref:dihydrolipoyl dehydrogenase n=1 Tax=Paenibacillus sp. GD4 TaxID=3068890 RepID=UPI0027965146|nr:dihydrolipoyl dehydrogenase [Paenibacillus sp. GD4]MDQ1909506.1 dihydrolipoyl dehydrogenase [Paenibacillus sp. GD4]